MDTRYKPDYEHLKCDECDGIIGIYGRGNVICNQCGKEFVIYRLKYDRLLPNVKTGWIFPVVDKEAL